MSGQQQKWGERADGQMASEERTLCCVPKNRSCEHRVMAKTFRTRKNKEEQRFIEVREWWFKFGIMEEPIATGKGTMIHREHIPVITVALLAELDPQEFTLEHVEQLKTQLKRIEDGLKSRN